MFKKLCAVVLLLCLVFPKYSYANIDDQIASAKTNITNTEVQISKIKENLSNLIKDSYKFSTNPFAIFSIQSWSSYFAFNNYTIDIKNRIVSLAKELENKKEELQNTLSQLEAQKKEIDSMNGWDESEFNLDKYVFVEKWGNRINKYLEGSPLSGYGGTFATAAYEYRVDPRWSPAISSTESTKGQFCFAPHNAWGWGNSGWNSWEEAINIHVASLKAGYGTSITVEAAQKYCPPNWENWYVDTLAEMQKI